MTVYLRSDAWRLWTDEDDLVLVIQGARILSVRGKMRMYPDCAAFVFSAVYGRQQSKGEKSRTFHGHCAVDKVCGGMGVWQPDFQRHGDRA